MKAMKVLVIKILVLLLLVSVANSAEVVLQWNPVINADGYKVYYGMESRTYLTPENTTKTSHTILLDPGTYYFAVTAYNNHGESGYSEEAGPTIIPQPVPLQVIASVITNPNTEWIIFGVNRIWYKFKNENVSHTISIIFTGTKISDVMTVYQFNGGS